jgi:hypothetical protein
MKNIKTPVNSLEHQIKDKHFYTQLQKTFECFLDCPKTMLMCAKETGIERANVCRYVRTMRNNGMIWLVKKGFCDISKHHAGYYTTNQALIPKVPQQLNLF